MIIENSESIYKALLKVNQIGKKLSTTSEYILSNGIILGHSKQGMSDTEANPISIGFIENNLLKKIEGLGDKIGLLIDGGTLYDYSGKYDFDSISISDNGIDVNFVYFSVDDNGYMENFKSILKDKGFKEESIEMASLSGYTNDMDMYDLLLKYRKEVSPELDKTLISVKCKYVTINNFMYNAAEKIINKLNESECLYAEENIDRDILDLIINNRQPVIRKLKLDNDKILKVRLMKSLFTPIATKNSAGIYIYKDHKDYILSVRVDLTGVTLFNLYKVLDY